MKIVGIDFSSAPRARKPITLTVGELRENPVPQGSPDILHIREHLRLPSLEDFERWLAAPGSWVAGCDFPFGLPRPFLRAQGWGCWPTRRRRSLRGRKSPAAWRR